MFKFLPLLVLGFIACTLAQPTEKPKVVEILKSEIEKRPDGGYITESQGADGTTRKEEATVELDEDGKEYLLVKGSYTYYNDVGELVEVTYTAGKNGFVPSGQTINADITKTAEEAKYLPRPEPEHA